MTTRTSIDDGADESLVLDCARSLARFVMVMTSDAAGRVRAEDALTLAATVVAERVLDAAGEIDPRSHDHVAGRHIFSERVNELLCGGRGDVPARELPPNSVFGLLLRSAGEGYGEAAFPDLAAVFRGFAERVGADDDWGSVPLSVPAEHRPHILPIQAGFQTRAEVDALLEPAGDDRRARLTAATLALALTLQQTAAALAPATAMLLVAEVVNGMAKTAPITPDAMARYEAARAGRDG